MTFIGLVVSDWVSVFALDPGGTTGWSILSVYADCLVDSDVSILASINFKQQGEVSGAEDNQTDEIMNILVAWPEAAIVVERFQLRQMAVELSPVRITAKLEYALHTAIAGQEWGGDDGVDDLVEAGWVVDDAGQLLPRRIWLQDPGMAKQAATNERLKDWGLYVPGSEHARDATRHAITFLRRCKDVPKLRQNAWPWVY